MKSIRICIAAIGPKWKGRAAFTRSELLVMTGVVSVLGLLFVPAHLAQRAKNRRIACMSNLMQVGVGFQVFAGDHDGAFPYLASNSVAYGERQQAWIHFQAMSNELSGGVMAQCPEDIAKNQREQIRAYPVGSGEKPKKLLDLKDGAVSYFVGINATLKMPFAVLSGDRNIGAPGESRSLTPNIGAAAVPTNSQWTVSSGGDLHGNQGNLLLSDGSVYQTDNGSLQRRLATAVEMYGTNGNILLFPR